LQNDTPCIQEETIDLRELFAVLKRRKKLIWMTTGIITLLAFVYVLTATPIYRGSMTLEIGEVIKLIDNEKDALTTKLDNVNNLKSIIESKFNITATIPKKATTVISYTATGSDKQAIKDVLKQAYAFTLKRHKEIAKLFADTDTKIRMTQLVNDISVGAKPVKPKKTLIVVLAFITGLMLSIFLAFFLEFLERMKNEE